MLERHLNTVTEAVEAVCLAQHGASLKAMATALIETFLHAKMQDIKTSAALYSVASDLDGAKISRLKQARSHKAIQAMLITSPQPLNTDAHLVATLLQGAMVGVSRQLLEAPNPERQLAPMRHELITLACGYLKAKATASAS